jgi:hypothetical protein
MGDISAFPSIANPLFSGDNIITLTATNAITAGMVVEIDATGISGAVNAAVAEAASKPIGVAVTSAGAGAKVAVATYGCVVYVANADDTATMDAGTYVITNDNAVGGTVSELLAVGDDATPQKVVGMLLEGMTAGGTARCLLTLGSITSHG